MEKLSILTIPFLLMVIVATSACKRPGGPPDEKVSSEASETEEHPQGAKYPRLYRKHFEAESMVEQMTPFEWPANTKVVQLFEESFQKHMQSGTPDQESSFAIQRGENDSLLIEFSPNAADKPRGMVAVWVRREKDDDGNSRILRRVSPPLSGEEEALLLLRSYASGEDGFESLLEWKEP